MILNITPDDKFVPFLQGLFDEAIPGGSLWRVLTDKPNPVFAAQNEYMRVVDDKYFYSEKFKKDLWDTDCVIFHSLMLSRRQEFAILRRIPKQIPIVWRGWGFDYYGYLEANGLRLILPETKALTEQLRMTNRPPVKQLPRRILKKLLSETVGRLIKYSFMTRINYFSCCVPDDYAALQRALPMLSAQFLPLNYYSKEDIFLRGCSSNDLSGKDILLGNSATSTNNHIEAMIVLSRLGMYGRKVIVPLSYGDTRYQEKVIHAGKDLLGESFVPLTEYLSLPEYNQIISGCGILMMNHVRQQAIGNISAALLRGGKVFLRPENPIYKYYTRMGVKLFCITPELTVGHFDVELGKEVVLQNKEIMTSIWAREQGIRQVRKISILGTVKI